MFLIKYFHSIFTCNAYSVREPWKRQCSFLSYDIKIIIISQPFIPAALKINVLTKILILYKYDPSIRI